MGNNWYLIADSVNDTLNNETQSKYEILDEKLRKLKNVQTNN